MTRVLLRLRADGRSEWMGVDGVVREGWPTPRREERVVVLVPGEDVLLLEVPRIAGSERQWSQALPFLAEEQLVLPIESQHVAWSRISREECLRVAVVTRARMDGWLAQLHEAGLEPDSLLPEALALPWHPDRSTLLVDGDRCVLRLGESSALTGNAGEIAALVEFVAPASVIETWRVGDSQSPLPAQPQHVVPHALHAFATQQDAGLNLLQGDYAPRRRTGDLARAWRRAAALACIALLLGAFHPLLDRHKLAGKVAMQRAEMVQLYRRAVKDATEMDDPARRMQVALSARGLGHRDGAVNLLAQIASTIAADDRLVLDSLEYRDRRLELIVQAGSVANLDGLRQRLTRIGLTAEIVGTTPGTQGVQGRLRIGAKP